MSALISNVESGVDGTDAYRDFVRVGCEDYPHLGAYYAARIGAWFDANYPVSAERHHSD